MDRACPRGPAAIPGTLSTSNAFRIYGRPGYPQSISAAGTQYLCHSLKALAWLYTELPSAGTAKSVHPEPPKMGFSFPPL